jgi:hypothetical protein
MARVSDERLRELERVWRATGSTDDRLRWLLERRRAGALSIERLELGVHCGHELAEVVLAQAQGREPTLVDTKVEGWLKRWRRRTRTDWVRSLEAWGMSAITEYARSLREQVEKELRGALPGSQKKDRVRRLDGPSAVGFSRELQTVFEAPGPFVAVMRLDGAQARVRTLFHDQEKPDRIDHVLAATRLALADWALA